MIRFLFILFFLSAACVSFGQSENPFEIRQGAQAVEEIVEADAEPVEKIQINSDNPFEVYTSTGVTSESEVIIAPQKTTKTTNTKVKGPSKGLTLIYVVLALILLSVAISLNRSRFNTIIGSLVNGNNLKNLHRGNKPWTDVQSLLLYGLFFLNSTFFLWLVGARLFGGQIPSYLYLLLGLGAVYLIRHLSMIILSEIFMIGNIPDQFNYSIALHNMGIGVVLIPFILSLGYVSDQNIEHLFYISLRLRNNTHFDCLENYRRGFITLCESIICLQKVQQ